MTCQLTSRSYCVGCADSPPHGICVLQVSQDLSLLRLLRRSCCCRAVHSRAAQTVRRRFASDLYLLAVQTPLSSR